MDLHVTNLEPQNGAFNSRSLFLVHSQEIDVKPPRCLQIGANDRHMIERSQINGGALRHVAIIAQGYNERDVPPPCRGAANNRRADSAPDLLQSYERCNSACFVAARPERLAKLVL